MNSANLLLFAVVHAQRFKNQLVLHVKVEQISFSKQIKSEATLLANMLRL